MLFPWFDEETKEILKEDIKKYGQRDSIKRLKGVIIDGKNRLRALKDLEIEPKIEDLPEDTNLVAYVKAVGLCRRDLTPTKRWRIAKALDKYEEEQLPKEEKQKIEEWKKDPKKREILKKKKQKKIATEARTTIEVVKNLDEIEEEAEKGNKKAKNLLDKLENEDIKSVSTVHKEVVGTVKIIKPKPKEPTREQLIEDLTFYKYDNKRLKNINTRLIKYIKEKGFWDEIKGEFSITEMTPSADPTPKQLREAEQL